MGIDVLDSSRNLTHQLTHELGKAIVQGQYKMDADFPTEAELSERFQISRSVTREAVKMLTAKGLISSRPRKGIRVQPVASWNMFDTDVLNWTATVRPSLRLLKEFTQLRMAIEPEAVGLACASADLEQLENIGLAVELIELAEKGEHDPLEAEVSFHTALLLASNNRFYGQFCEFIRAAARLSVACRSQIKAVPGVSSVDYRVVYECIHSGQSAQGSKAMRALLETTLDAVLASLAESRKSVSSAADAALA